VQSHAWYTCHGHSRYDEHGTKQPCERRGCRGDVTRGGGTSYDVRRCPCWLEDEANAEHGKHDGCSSVHVVDRRVVRAYAFVRLCLRLLFHLVPFLFRGRLISPSEPERGDSAWQWVEVRQSIPRSLSSLSFFRRAVSRERRIQRRANQTRDQTTVSGTLRKAKRNARTAAAFADVHRTEHAAKKQKTKTKNDA